MTSPLQVLHLEDDPNDVELIRSMLQAEGMACDVQRVEGHDDFVEALERGGFDIILADYNLPAFDGISALAIAREKCPDVPFILVSAALGEERAVGAVKSGATDYVLKQRLGGLAPSVQRALREREERSKRKQIEADMRKLSMALEQTADMVFITDRSGVIEYVNPAFEAVTGFSREEALGNTPAMLRSIKQDARYYERMWESLRRGEIFRDVLINRRKNGELFYQEQTITPLKNHEDEIIHFVSTGKDITERIQSEERLHRLANYDVLTGLPNRALFTDRLGQAIAAASGNRPCAIVLLGLDRFRVVNDTLGHASGDRLLQAAAERLLDCVSEADTVARVGGDEFAILLDEVSSVDEVGIKVQQVLGVISKAFDLDGQEIFLTASAGISLCPIDGKDVASVIANADVALTRAEGQGGNRYQFYSADMNAKAFESLTLETKLRYALEREQFVLHYQPQVDLRDGNIIGVEALIRWNDPQTGLIPPGAFIPLLEDTGLIVPVGVWALRKACEQAMAWQASGLRQIRIAVNLSARQLNDLNLLETVGVALADTGLPAELLELEITESVAMQHAQDIIDILQGLNAVGIKLAIDDFGTGYSSLAYLNRFPIHTLKIDRTFINEIGTKQDATEIVRTILSLASTLRLTVVAEGVETKEQMQFLCAQGCGGAQGFYFGRPVVADEIGELLKSGASLPRAKAVQPG